MEGLAEKNSFLAARQDHRMPEFWSVSSSYTGYRDQTLSGRGKGQGEDDYCSRLLYNRVSRERFHGHGEMDLRIENQGISRAADRPNGIVSWSATSRVTSAAVQPLSPSETRPPVSSARRGGLALTGLPQRDNSRTSAGSGCGNRCRTSAVFEVCNLPHLPWVITLFMIFIHRG